MHCISQKWNWHSSTSHLILDYANKNDDHTRTFIRKTKTSYILSPSMINKSNEFSPSLKRLKNTDVSQSKQQLLTLVLDKTRSNSSRLVFLVFIVAFLLYVRVRSLEILTYRMCITRRRTLAMPSSFTRKYTELCSSREEHTQRL